MKCISSPGSLSLAICNDYANFILTAVYFSPFPEGAFGQKGQLQLLYKEGASCVVLRSHQIVTAVVVTLDHC